MSSYTITVMTANPKGILPQIVNMRNTYKAMSNLLGGPVQTFVDKPIPGIVILAGPLGEKGKIVIAKSGGGHHWSGLSIEEQKRVMSWFIRNLIGRSFSNE